MQQRLAERLANDQNLTLVLMLVLGVVLALGLAALITFTSPAIAIAALALYFLVVNVVDTRARFERVVRALIIAGGISAMLGILFYLLPHDLTIRLLSLLRVFKYPTGNAVLRFIEDNPQNALRAVSTS